MAKLGAIDFTSQVYSKTAVDNLLRMKQDVLVFDDTPTAGSVNPVTSWGIKLYVDDSIAGLGKILNWCGSVPTYADLPTENVRPGDVYNVEEDGMNVAATLDGSNDIVWDPLGPSMDIYLTKEEAASTYATKTELSDHTGNTSNPHQVTKSQVGLGNVDNTSDLSKPISSATQFALNGKVSKTGDTMTGDLVFRRGGSTVTVSHTGLEVYKDEDSTVTIDYESVGFKKPNGQQNWIYFPDKNGTFALTSDIPVITGKADKVQNATAGNFAGLDASGNLTDSGKKASDFATSIDLSNHVANTSNPHQVTKSQVGLGNVDNTSDLDKPVSTAVQSALNLKQDQFVVLKYGVSTWAEFQEAYRKNAVIFCLNGSRMGIIGYVTATQVEFNYYRSIQRHTASLQADQFLVYKLDENSVWSSSQRDTMLKNVAGNGIETTVHEQVGLGTISYAVKPKTGGGIGVDENGVYVDLSPLSSVSAQIAAIRDGTAGGSDLVDVVLAMLDAFGYTAS